MAQKKSQWQLEQERRRRDLLALKNEETAEEEPKKEISPQTFGEKVSNFWYHNKWSVIALLGVAAVVLVCALQIIRRPSYDCQVVLYVSSFVDKPTSDALEAELEKYCPDTNGDGEVNVLIIDCCIYEWLTSDQITERLDTVRSQLIATETVVFVVDDNTMTQLDNAGDGVFAEKGFAALDGRGIPLKGSSIDQAVQAADTEDTFLQNYYIAMRGFDPSKSDAVAKRVETANRLLENIQNELNR